MQTYLNAHERVLRTYSKFMDKPRQYKLTQVTPNYLLMECDAIQFTTNAGTKLRIDITKDVEIDDSNPRRLLACTVGYSYHAHCPGVGNLMRYDSPDLPSALTAATPHHHRFHHKHVWQNGREQILRIDDDQWPHVDEFFLKLLSNY